MAISTSPRRKASTTARPTSTSEAFSSTDPASPLPHLLAGLRWGAQGLLAPAAVLAAIVLFAGWSYLATYFAYFRVPVESLGLTIPEVLAQGLRSILLPVSVIAWGFLWPAVHACLFRAAAGSFRAQDARRQLYQQTPRRLDGGAL